METAVKDLVTEKIRETIRTNGLIAAGDKVILGFSGGPDSLCLFDVLEQLQEELGFTLSCVHVNHGLRPGAADEDQRFVEEICEERGVALEVRTADCRAAARELGLTEEEAGRQLRYDCFSESAAALAAQGPARVRIAVAQNRQDQAETVLMRLFRGTGTDGLAGMDYSRPERGGFAVIRPLLDVDRADIEAYLDARGLTPRRDLTNDSTDYHRNRIRNELLPYLAENYNPQIVDALTRAADNAREDSRYLKKLAEQSLWEAQFAAGEVPVPANVRTIAGDTAPASVCLDLEILREAPLPVRHRVLRMAFERIGLVQDIAAVHLAAMDRLIENGRTSQETSLPGGYVLRIGYDAAECMAPVEKPGESETSAGKTGESEALAEGPVAFAGPGAERAPGEAGTPAGAPAADPQTGIAGLQEDAPKGTPGRRTANGRARILTRAQLLREIERETGRDPAITDDERIRAYIYSKNFTGIGEASCVLDANKVEALLARVADERDAGAVAAAGEPAAPAQTAAETGATAVENAAAAGESAQIPAGAPFDLAERIDFRTRRAGDRLPLREGSKRIQDLMVDEKIPRTKRDGILLAAAGSTVLFVAGGTPRPRYAAGCAAGAETERFLVLEMTMPV